MPLSRAESPTECNETFVSCTDRAIEAARAHLGKDGLIDYGTFESTTLQALNENPGCVRCQANIVRPEDEFVSGNNNFHMGFHSDWVRRFAKNLVMNGFAYFFQILNARFGNGLMIIYGAVKKLAVMMVKMILILSEDSSRSSSTSWHSSLIWTIFIMRIK